jgi:hypothetical protein
MNISEQELRSMIRSAIAARGAAGPPPAEPSTHDAGARGHASHQILALVPSGDQECIIEPSVPCDHCGYCKSLGH